MAFVFSDPAGANACIALSRMYASENGEYPMLFSNKMHFQGPVENFHLTETVPDFESLNIDCVFTGTSHPASSNYFEVNCIREAKRKNIYTISFVDHWVNFRLRFEGLAKTEFPDEIWVVDSRAKELAIKEGLEDIRIKVVGNPYHYYLKNIWQPGYVGKDYLRQLNIRVEGMHILYAPDPISLRFPVEEVGFSEATALDDLLNVVDGLSDVHVIVKTHPLQSISGLQAVIDKHADVNCTLVTIADIPELLNAVNIVVGFYSNILLEAKALNKNVIRYFPGDKEFDQLKHALDFKPLTRSREDLRTELKLCLYG